jgi:YesN/AraC family two-component response regulator
MVMSGPARRSGPLNVLIVNVLIVEDDVHVRTLFRLALEGIARVLEAADFEQALRSLEQNAASALDVVLVDQIIPGGSGLELLGLIRRKWPWVSVVVITGFGSEDLAIQAFRVGASDYLRKPIDVEELRRVTLTHARSQRFLANHGVNLPEAIVAFSEEARALHPEIFRALGFIREHFTEPITFAQVARETRLSKFHFCRLFRRQVGASFREYLHGLRIDRAKLLLSERQLTVTEVAYAVGFSDLSHFDKMFHRIVGTSPTGYRRAIQAA